MRELRVTTNQTSPDHRGTYLGDLFRHQGKGMEFRVEKQKSKRATINYEGSKSDNIATSATFHDAIVLRKALNRLYKLLGEAFSGNVDALKDQIECMRCIREVLDKSKEGPLLVSSLKYMLLQLRASMKQHKSNSLFEEHVVNAMLAAIGVE